MSIRILNYGFDGPHASSDQLKRRSGIYVIVHRANGQWRIIDVGESGNIRVRIENHDRKSCWRKQAGNSYQFAAHYTTITATARRRIEARIRDEYKPPCGTE